MLLIGSLDSHVRGWDYCIGPDGYVYSYAAGGYYAGPVYRTQGAYETARPAYAEPQYQTRQYGGRPADGQSSRRVPVVQMTDQARFEPAHITVSVGQTVEWRSASRHPHTVTGDPDLVANPAHVVLPEDAEPFDSGEIAPGGRYSYTFKVPGIYYYVCLPHEEMGMVGIVVVRSPREGERRAPAPPQGRAPQAQPQSPGGTRGY